MKPGTLRFLATIGTALIVTIPAVAGDWSLDGSARLRYEDWSWFEADANDDYSFFGSLIRVGFSGKQGTMDWKLEVAQPTLLSLPRDAVAPAPQGQLGLGATYSAVNDNRDADLGLFIKNGYLRLGVGDASWLKVGRFEFIEGVESMPGDATLAAVKRSRVAHRLIGNFGFSHVGRSFDAMQYSQEFGEANWTIFAGRPTEGVFSVDGWNQLDVDLVYTAVTRSAERYDSRLFGIAYMDDRGTRLSDNRGVTDLGEVAIYTIGGHYLRSFDFAAGGANVLFWGAWQTGDWGTLDHDAKAYALEFGFHPGGASKPALRVGWFSGDGDSDPTDRDHETFFQVLPTPRIYARFPFYNLMNTEDAFVEGSLMLRDSIKLTAAIHSVDLSEADDRWYVGGGAFNDGAFGFPSRPSGGHTDLANIIDVGVNWTVTKSQSVAFYAGFADGGNVVRSIYPSGSDGRYGFLEYTKTF